MSASQAPGAIVVGVLPGQVRDVFTVAAAFAARFALPLICVTVDPSLLDTGTRADGSEIIESLDPDAADATLHPLEDEDVALARQLAASHAVTVEFLTCVGDPARALAATAEERGAAAIVVGTQTGRRRVAEFLTGSIATRLAHHQHRPVVVVPIDPTGFTTPSSRETS